MMNSNTRNVQSKIEVVVPTTTQRRSSRNHHRSVLEVVTTTPTSLPPNNDSEDDDDDDDDDDDTPLTKLVAKQKRKEILKSNQKRRLTVESSSDDDDSLVEMTEDEHPPPPTTTTRKVTADTTPLVTLSTTASPLTCSPDTQPPHSNRRGSIIPPRASAVKASRTFLNLDDSDSDDDSSLEVIAAKITTTNQTTTTTRRLRQTNKNAKTPQKAKTRNSPTTAATAKKKRTTGFDSDDEEYQDNNDDPSNDDDDSDDDSAFVGDIDDDDDEISEANNIKTKKSRDGMKVGIVREQDIGEQEIDDDDDNDDDSSNIVIPKPFGSPRLELIEPRLHRPALQHDDSDDSGNYSSSIIGEDNHKMSTQKSQSVIKKMPKCIRCDSTKDAVTADDLPPIHICFFPPDNQNKQCFALETLRKIALAQPNSRRLVVNTSNGTIERPTEFLQPPHFRTPMSDDLLDQIASRFGRAATDVHGEYYRRNDENYLPLNEAPSNTQRTPGSSQRLAQSESIIDQLDRYMRQGLGNQDIYCCPICYVVAHQRLVNGEPDDNDNNDNDYWKNGKVFSFFRYFSLAFVFAFKNIKKRVCSFV